MQIHCSPPLLSSAAAVVLLVVFSLIGPTPASGSPVQRGPEGSIFWGNNVCQVKLITGRVGGWDKPGDTFQRTMMLISGGLCVNAFIRLYYTNRWGSPTTSERYLTDPRYFISPEEVFARTEDWWFGGNVDMVRGCVKKEEGPVWDCRDIKKGSYLFGKP